MPEALRLLDIRLRLVVQIFLARLIDEDLVNRLAEEAPVEAAQRVPVVRLVHNFDEVSLLKQTDRVLDALGCVSAPGEG